MILRSQTWVHISTVALACVAMELACPAVSRAGTLPSAELSPNMLQAAQALTAAPNAVNLQALRSILVNDPKYDPYSADLTELEGLVHAGKNDEALALFAKSLPNLELSPRAHYLASVAGGKSGNKDYSDRERQFELCCLQAVLDTGDGSESRPLLIARISDEADLLDAQFHTQIGSHALIFQGDKRLDQVLGKDGGTYWFDVSMIFAHPLAAAVPQPVAAAPGGTGPDGRPMAESPAAAVRPTTPASQGASAIQNVAAKKEAQRGLDAYHAGRYEEALSALNEAISIEPDNAGIHVDRGNVNYAQRDYAQAVVDFSEAIRLDPNYATAYSNRAFALSTLGDQDQAITDFNVAIRLQPNNGRAYNGRGSAYKAKEMIDTAIADFDVAIRLNPSYAAAYENRSSAYAKKGNKALADADAAKARELRGAKASSAPSAEATASVAPRGQ